MQDARSHEVKSQQTLPIGLQLANTYYTSYLPHFY